MCCAIRILAAGWIGYVGTAAPHPTRNSTTPFHPWSLSLILTDPHTGSVRTNLARYAASAVADSSLSLGLPSSPIYAQRAQARLAGVAAEAARPPRQAAPPRAAWACKGEHLLFAGMY